MAYITTTELGKYTGVVEDDTTMQSIYIDASENIVEDYLGFKLDTLASIPGIIKMTILRIAALLQTESDNNIGVTSKTFGESGSRTFVKTTDYQPYLLQISSYVKV
jgi:hypothetical protein